MKTFNSISGRTIEVSTFDLPKLLNWNEAQNACNSLGNGWRLPSEDELDTMFCEKQYLGNFTNGNYWTSSKYGPDGAWRINFGNGEHYRCGTDLENNVRAVRTLY